MKNTNNSKLGKELIPVKYQNLVFILLIFISVYTYFYPAINSGGFAASDNIASQSFEPFKKEMEKKGEFTLWIPYIFSGMPSYESLLLTGNRYWDVPTSIMYGTANFFKALFNSDVARVAFYYFLYGVGIFLLLNLKGQEKFVSFIAAIGAVFSTSVIVWITIGHNTKPVVLSLLPFLFYSIERLRLKFSLLFFVILALTLHLMLEAAHLQIIFYSFLALAIYFLVELSSSIIKKTEIKGIVTAILCFVVAISLAFAMSSDRYLATADYTKNSTRGSAPTLDTDNPNLKKTNDGGNPYDYATMWSYSPNETFTFLVPNYFGFGHLKFDKDAPENSDKLLSRLYEGNNLPRTYWGSKESEDAPPYMGIIIFVFGIFGLMLNYKENFVKFLAISSVIFLFLSFGKNLSFLYDLFYYYFPNFNKFRAPSMALAGLNFTMPILAAFGISSILKICSGIINIKNLKYLLYFGILFLGLGLLFKFGGESFYKNSVNADSFISMNIGDPRNFNPQIVDQLKTEYLDFMFQSASNDWVINGILLLTAILFSLLLYKKIIQKSIFFILLALLVFIDLWRVDYRKFDYSEGDYEETFFREYDYIKFLKSDKDKFRVADFVLSANMPAYFLIENVNGYHSAKLRIYQDLMDATSNGSTSYVQDEFLWQLMNVKYIIEKQEIPSLELAYKSQETGANVYLNPYFLERYYFVDTFNVSTAKEILTKFKNKERFNPKEIVYLEEKPNITIEKPSIDNKIKVIKSGNQHLELEVDCKSNNILNISEIYYKPGWFAKIDGKDLKIYKSNFAFRSVIVPKGKHKLEFYYQSNGFELGKKLSIASNVLIGLLLLISIVLSYKKKKINE